MEHGAKRDSPRSLLLAALLFLSVGVAAAENIDPNHDNSKLAWAENLGWINLQPAGPGGSGVQVSDTKLTGWAWSENAGWISLSCSNTSSCGANGYEVSNDGCGLLGGYAWSENAGWVNFAAGVTIDPVTGIFSGPAWSENAGWIMFDPAGLNRVVTGWRRAVPAGAPKFNALTKSGVSDLVLTWLSQSGATWYDFIYGSLSSLRSSHGDFSVSTQPCIANDTSLTSWSTTGNPAPGDGYWFLLRGGNCGGAGTYDDSVPPDQVESRDPEVAASPGHCSPP